MAYKDSKPDRITTVVLSHEQAEDVSHDMVEEVVPVVHLSHGQQAFLREPLENGVRMALVIPRDTPIAVARSL